MTSQDGLALLRQMYERGEITDQQYDALRRHVLWGTPLPDLEDLPAPRSADPLDGYAAGVAATGPDRRRYAGPPGHPAGPAGTAGTAEPTGQVPRRYASRRERREAEEAAAHRRAPARRLAPAFTPPPPGRTGRTGSAGYAGPEGSAGPPPPVGGLATPRADEPATSRSKKATRAKKRPRRRSVVAVLTSVVLALALAAGGVYWFELRRQGLPPTAYARQACGTVRDWQQAVDASNATLVGQISREQNKSTIRADVTAYYTTIADRTDRLRTAILGLGPADLPGGQEYADSLAAAVGDQANGLRALAGQAGRLNPAAATFPTDLHGVLTGADAAVSAVSAALARPAAGITTELRTTLSNEPACVPYVG